MGNTNWLFLIAGIVLLLALMGKIDLQSIAGSFTSGTSATGTSESGLTTMPIDSITFGTVTEGANSYTADSTGAVKIYQADADPTDPNANPIVTISMSSGVGSDTNGLVNLNTPYRVIYDGAGTYYGEDLGVIKFDSTNYNANTGKFTYSRIPIETIATITDMGDETATSGSNAPLVCNGQSANTHNTTELYGTTDALEYDESVGDGTFTICSTIGAEGGANKYLKDVVLEFRWSLTTPPEGNEISSIVAQHKEGTSFNVPSELVNYWSNQGIVPLSDKIASGTSGVYKLTFTVNEANLDANDDWTLFIDDLGSYFGKDVGMDTGATADSVSFDSQA